MDPQRIAGGFGLSEGMQVSDFGTGAGYFTIIVARLVGSTGVVNGIDIMESALASVRAKAEAAGLSNIRYIKANLEVSGGTGLADDSQDMVLLANTLFQSDKKLDIILEARRVLKPGRNAIMIDWHKGTGGFGPPDNLRTDPEEMKKIFTDQGFVFVGNIDAGVFHFGMSFKKP